MRTIEEIKAEYIAELDKAAETGKETKARSLRAELVNALTKSIPTDRLESICAAERDGRCAVLPCKVGDYLWVNSRYCNRNVPPEKVPCSIYPNCKGCPFKKIEPTPIKVCSMETLGGFLDRNEIGKVLHLTREEAEAALRKEQGDETHN